MQPIASRTAYLVLTALFWLAVVVGVALVAHRLFGLGQGSSVLTVPVTISVDEDDVALPERFEIAGGLPVSADLADPVFTQRSIAAVPVLARWALAIAVLWLVRGLARSAAEGDPFRGANVVRLRWLGALFLLGYPLATVVGAAATHRLFSPGVWTGGPVPGGGIQTSYWVLSWPAIMAGVSLFALAEVFAHGVRLREDVDATI
jgi:hypothetical protein